MDIEKDFENDSENLDDDVDHEIDNKNFTGKLHQFMLSEDFSKNTETVQSHSQSKMQNVKVNMLQGNPKGVVQKLNI